jgi:hypothetical protein
MSTKSNKILDFFSKALARDLLIKGIYLCVPILVFIGCSTILMTAPPAEVNDRKDSERRPYNHLEKRKLLLSDLVPQDGPKNSEVPIEELWSIEYHKASNFNKNQNKPYIVDPALFNAAGINSIPTYYYKTATVIKSETTENCDKQLQLEYCGQKETFHLTSCVAVVFHDINCETFLVVQSKRQKLSNGLFRLEVNETSR